jgi:hypothetical protein
MGARLGRPSGLDYVPVKEIINVILPYVFRTLSDVSLFHELVTAALKSWSSLFNVHSLYGDRDGDSFGATSICAFAIDLNPATNIRIQSTFPITHKFWYVAIVASPQSSTNSGTLQ